MMPMDVNLGVVQTIKYSNGRSTSLFIAFLVLKWLQSCWSEEIETLKVENVLARWSTDYTQLELTAPGDMVYLKHSPAMRSYVVLRGTVLLTNNVLDREGAEVRDSQGTKDEGKVSKNPPLL